MGGKYLRIGAWESVNLTYEFRCLLNKIAPQKPHTFTTFLLLYCTDSLTASTTEPGGV